ncbi:hypothetical protein [Succinimonas sp.]|uniref:hypothetical protein n=1 Tax=Succinimonas sp. TaxID=1936151 RepID=UPI003867F51F
MTTPVATLSCVTATGDVVMSSGYATRLYNGLPVSCTGDTVSGAACVGTVVSGSSVTHTNGGLPPAGMGSAVTGTNPETGAVVTTTIASTYCSNRIV